MEKSQGGLAPKDAGDGYTQQGLGTEQVWKKSTCREGQFNPGHCNCSPGCSGLRPEASRIACEAECSRRERARGWKSEGSFAETFPSRSTVGPCVCKYKMNTLAPPAPNWLRVTEPLPWTERILGHQEAEFIGVPPPHPCGQFSGAEGPVVS